MNLVLVTTADAPFDGALWTSYKRSGGTPPDTAFLLPSQSFGPRWQSFVEPFVLFNVGSLARLSSARFLDFPITSEDRELGLHRSLREVFPATDFHEVETLNQDPGLESLVRARPDVLLSVGAPEIFSPEVLDVPAHGAFNLHNGRLPQYRGMFATFWELYYGEGVGGISFHHMVPEVDAGTIVCSADVSLTDDLFEILVRKKLVGGKLLVSCLTESAGCLDTSEQAEEDEADEGYHSWPTLRHMLRMRLSRQRAADRPGLDPPHAEGYEDPGETEA